MAEIFICIIGSLLTGKIWLAVSCKSFSIVYVEAWFTKEAIKQFDVSRPCTLLSVEYYFCHRNDVSVWYCGKTESRHKEFLTGHLDR